MSGLARVFKPSSYLNLRRGLQPLLLRVRGRTEVDVRQQSLVQARQSESAGSQLAVSLESGDAKS